MVRVKICGITNVDDVRCVVREGADAFGLVFAKSPRQVNPETAKKIVKAAGPLMLSVGVFVNESSERMLRIAEYCRLSTLQLHGDESAGVIRKIQKYGYPVIRAFRIGEKEELQKINDSPADALLFDTSQAGKFGGTGRVFDWSYLKKNKIRTPWIVSGGLNPTNVKTLLAMLDPYGVDVSSGVEQMPGKKSEKLVKEFIQNAKAS